MQKKTFLKPQFERFILVHFAFQSIEKVSVSRKQDCKKKKYSLRIFCTPTNSIKTETQPHQYFVPPVLCPALALCSSCPLVSCLGRCLHNGHGTGPTLITEHSQHSRL